MEDNDVLLMNYLEERYWFWKAKEDLYRKLIMRYAPNKKVALDIGCGGGVLLKVLGDLKHEVYGIDLSKKSIDICSENHPHSKLRVGNAEKLPYINKFDLILASDMLEHCDDKLSIQSIHRALKDDGVLIMTIPMFKHLFGQDDIRLKHKRRYTPQMVKELLAEFHIINLSYIQMSLYFPAIIFRVIERVFNMGKSFETFFKERILITSERTELGELTLLLSLPIKSIFILLNSIIKYEQFLENYIAVSLGLPVGVGMFVVCKKKHRP